jgi:hypothetical protein
MVTPLKNTTILPPKAPNLPVAPTVITQQYVERLTNSMRLYFNQVDNFAQSIALPDAGITANRPVTNVQIGQFYFDTSLGANGKPIWYNGTIWIDASGTAV